MLLYFKLLQLHFSVIDAQVLISLKHLIQREAALCELIAHIEGSQKRFRFRCRVHRRRLFKASTRAQIFRLFFLLLLHRLIFGNQPRPRREVAECLEPYFWIFLL
jgi:hypothetical protein